MRFSLSLSSVLLTVSFTAGLALIDRASATEPVVTKLHGRHTGTPEYYGGGLSVAVSDRYVLMGERNNDDLFDEGGAVHVYSAATGRYLRKLTPSDGDADDNFGWSIAVVGTTALIGAPGYGPDETGKVYVFDLRNGREKLGIVPADAGAGDQFGISVSADGTHVLVGAPLNDESAFNGGAAYVFDYETGEQISKLLHPSGGGGSDFGVSVGLSGALALVGAPKTSDGAIEDGMAFLFDEETGSLLRQFHSANATDHLNLGASVALSGTWALIGAPGDDEAAVDAGAAWCVSVLDGGFTIRLDDAGKIFAPNPDVGDEFGYSLSLSGRLALIGSGAADNPSLDVGVAAIYEIDPLGHSLLTELVPVEIASYDYFGSAVAICGNRAVVGASGDDDLAQDSGAAYYYRDAVGSLPGWSLTQKGNAAPGAVDAEFRRFVQPVFSDGNVGFSAFLSGPGSNRNLDTGLWVNPAGPLELALKSRQPLDAFGADFVGQSSGRITVKGAGSSFLGGRIVFESTITGPGAGGRNNRALFAVDSDSPPTSELLLRLGTPIPELNDSEVRRMLDARSDGFAAVPYLLRGGTGDASSLTDSGVLGFDVAAAGIDSSNLRERNTGAFGEWRQFLGRASVASFTVLTGAHFVPAGETKPVIGLVRHTDGEPFVQAGDAEYGGSGATFRSFLGEGVWDEMEEAIFRATLKGAGVTGRNNEAIFLEKTGETPAQILREDAEIDPVGLPGVKVSRFLKWWASNQFFALVKLRGPGVNASNDCALIACEDGAAPYENWHILMREGDSAPGCDGARIRVIQRVEVDQDGYVAAVTSLTGSPALNQALLIASTSEAFDEGDMAFAAPAVFLRKGTYFQAAAGDTTMLRSLLLPTVNDRFGVAGQGQPPAMNGGQFTAVLTFSNRAQEVGVFDPFRRLQGDGTN